MKRFSLRMATRLTALAGLTGLLAGPARAESPKFYTSVNAPEVPAPIGHEGAFALGFFTNAALPLSNPFSATLPAGTPITVRYQIPIGLGLELNYGLGSAWELGLSAGYESFETVDEVDPSNRNKNQKITLHEVPVELNARFLMPMRSWRAEVEGGVGMGFASVLASEKDNLSNSEFTASAKRLRTHLALGAAFPWAEDFSVHLQAGLAFATLSSSRYVLPNGTVTQGNSFGIYSKASVRFQF